MSKFDAVTCPASSILGLGIQHPSCYSLFLLFVLARLPRLSRPVPAPSGRGPGCGTAGQKVLCHCPEAPGRSASPRICWPSWGTVAENTITSQATSGACSLNNSSQPINWIYTSTPSTSANLYNKMQGHNTNPQSCMHLSEPGWSSGTSSRDCPNILVLSRSLCIHWWDVNIYKK